VRCKESARVSFDDFLALVVADCVNARYYPSPLPAYDPIDEAHEDALASCPECGSAALRRGGDFFWCDDCAAYGHGRTVEGHK